MRRRKKKIVELFDAAVEAENGYEFQNAKRHYQKIVDAYKNSPEAELARERIVDMDALIQEHQLYRRIHRNARRILTEIGMDICECPELMDILIEADAIDLEKDTALFVPLREDCVERCLDQVPTDMAEDPGENAFGTGSAPPFLLRPGSDEDRPANKAEFEEIVNAAADYMDTLGIFSIPVATDKSISDFEASKLMDAHFSDLKMTYTRNMSDEEAAFFAGRDDWLDGTSLISSLTFMPTMVQPFLRSIRSGNNLLLLDLTIAGFSGPVSPEALLTQVHAQVLFMMVIAQIINPGVVCVHGGIPDILGISGKLNFADAGQPFINSAMARLNMWVTEFPSAQSGGSTSIVDSIPAAVDESERSRNTLRGYGVHILRHAMGAMGSLNYFNLDKFVQDCERERATRKIWLTTRHDLIVPLHVPEDKDVVRGIREIAEKGGPQQADHTLNNVSAFINWRKHLVQLAKEKVYYPQLRHALEKDLAVVERAPAADVKSQLPDTLFLEESE